MGACSALEDVLGFDRSVRELSRLGRVSKGAMKPALRTLLLVALQIVVSLAVAAALLYAFGLI